MVRTSDRATSFDPRAYTSANENHAQANIQTLRTKEKAMSFKVDTKPARLLGVSEENKRRGRGTYRGETRPANPWDTLKYALKQSESEEST